MINSMKRLLQSKFKTSQYAPNDSLKWRCPKGTEILPTHVSKRAEEEQMISSFQLIFTTHNAGIILHEEIISLKHCSCIQPIMN
jgi:hypothetical protein